MTDRSLLPTGWPAVSLAQANARLTAPGSPFEIAVANVRGVPVRVWKNAPPTLRELFLAGRAHGAKTFLVHEDDRVGFEAFARAAICFAHELRDQGVARGQRVAILMRNLPEWPVAFFGAILAGAIATPLNAWWSADELDYGLNDCGAEAAVLDAERYVRARDVLARCGSLRLTYVARAAATDLAGARSIESVIGAPAAWSALPDRPLPDVALAPDDDASIMYTSGTTGRPKGAVQTHRNGTCNTVAVGYSNARNFIRRGDPVPAPDPGVQRATLVSVPFFHTTGCHAILLPSLFAGGKLVMMRRWDTEQGMALIERERITAAGGVPTIAWQILEHPNRARYDLSSIEGFAYGGAPAAPELVRRLKAEFPRSHPGLGWGMTETTAAFASHAAEDYLNRPESTGPALPVCDMKIIDDAGRDLAAGEVGELVVKGPNVVRGYWNNPDATAQAFIDGWFRTGDLARIDDEGFLTIVDRKKDMLIRGGENIYCIEVESVLYQHPAVMDAALVPIAHKTLGEEPGAVVTLKPGQQATEAELRAFVAARLAPFKVPVRVLIGPDPLPRNANGKILKLELKRLFA